MPQGIVPWRNTASGAWAQNHLGPNARPLQVLPTKGTIGSFKGSKLGAGMKVSLIDLAPSITNASGKESEVGEIKNIGTAMDALEATQDNYALVVDRAILKAVVYSTQPFMFVPALVLAENGESFATAELDSEDPYSSITGNVAGVHQIKMGGEITPKVIIDTQVPFWVANIEWDLTKECNDYAKHIVKTLLAEDTNVELFLTYWIRTQDTGTVVAIRGIFSVTYHEIPMPISSVNYP
jgi:hypothetical protein